MPTGVPTLLAAAAAAPPPHLHPKPPYRAWFNAGGLPDEPYPYMPDKFFRGANLDLNSDANNFSACAEANTRGIATLHWAYGLQSPYAAKMNLSAATAFFHGYGSPLNSDAKGEWAMGGAAVDEWNPSSAANIGNEPAAAAGYRAAKAEWPWTFTAAFVTAQDKTFATLMLDGTFDLAVIEGYSYLPPRYHGGACGKECILSRLAHAKQEGYINRTINCYGMTCPKSSEYPEGFTVGSMCALISETKALYPEMPGVAFYGCGYANQTGMAELLQGINECAEKMYPDTWTAPATL